MQKNISIICNSRDFAKQVAAILAERLEMQYLDLFDMMLFDDKPYTFSQILELRGEAGVRAHEKSAIKYACDFSNTLIICEVGAIEDEENIKRLHQNSIIIYLHCTPKRVYDYLQNQPYESDAERDFFAKSKKVVDMRISLCKQNCDIMVGCSPKSPIVVASTAIRYLKEYAENL